MDFRLTDDLLSLQAEVREVAQRAAAGESIREDSWIRGFSREFSRELSTLRLRTASLEGLSRTQRREVEALRTRVDDLASRTRSE